LANPAPLEKLEVWNGNIAQTNVDQVATTTATTANSSTNLLGLSPGTCPVFGLTTNNLGVANTISGIANSFVQVGVDANGPAIVWGGTNSKLELKIDNSSTNCNPIPVADFNYTLGPYAMYLYGSAWTTGFGCRLIID
jgi:hypothetical protein